MSNPISHFLVVGWFLIGCYICLALPAGSPLSASGALVWIWLTLPHPHTLLTHTTVHHCDRFRSHSPPSSGTFSMFRLPTLDRIVSVVHLPPGYLGARERFSVVAPQWRREKQTTHPGAATERTTRQVGELWRKVGFPLAAAPPEFGSSSPESALR